MSNEKPSEPSQPAVPPDDPDDPRDATRGGVNGPALPVQRGRESPLSIDRPGIGRAPTVDSTEPFEAADPTELPTSDIDSEPDLEADHLLRAVAYSPPRQPRVAMATGTEWGDAGRYKIERRLGRGGMGTVYAATDTVLQRVVALKILDAVEPSQQASHHARLLREAQLAARVEHERVARVYDVGTHDGFAFVAMEYVPGGTLRQWMAGRQVPWPQVIDIATQIAEGLAELHNRGIVHRDLKPENVMLTAQGGIKLLDFGLARHAVVALDEPTGTPLPPNAPDRTTVATCGTPGYMAPEQYGNQPLDARIDVFALGVIVYELATGQRLFRGTTPREIMTATQNGPPPLTGGVWATAPERLCGCVGRMLALDPKQRFADGIKVLAALRDLAPALAPPRAGLPAATVTSDLTQPDVRPVGARNRRWTPRHVARASVIAAAAALAGIQGVRWCKGTAQLPTPPGMVRIDVGAIDVGHTAQEIERECQDLGSACERETLRRELPRTRVKVPAFFLDQYEVTNEQFAAFLDTLVGVLAVAEDEDDHYPRYVHFNRGTATTASSSDVVLDLNPKWSGIEYPPERRFRARPGYEKLAVAQVSWFGAKLYCEAHNKRLPTEDEWEAAARGRDDRRFPWGSDLPICGDLGPDGKPMTWQACPAGGTATARSAPATAQDVTPDGVHDLGGGVTEWTSSSYVATDRSAHPEDRAEDRAAATPRTIRGGSWAAWLVAMRSTWRTGLAPMVMARNVGFRCASNAEGARP